MIQLLQKLINARGPCGQENELIALLQEELSGVVDSCWVDPANNLIGKIIGTSKEKPPIKLIAHMDELSMIVKRVNDDGTLRVNPLGGILPAAFGQGPVEILGDSQILGGVLSFGSLHTSIESPTPHKLMPEEERGLGRAPQWEDVYVITRKSAQELKSLGVHAGSLVVIAQQRRALFCFEDCIGSYFLDNRAALVCCLLALKQLKKPPQDIYFIASSMEELGGIGASYAARTLPGDLALAVDVGPVAQEYGTELSCDPIVVYQDASTLYDLATNRRLLSLATARGIPVQTAIFTNYSSDASLAQLRGQTAKAALLAIPVANTHGFEVMHKESLPSLANLLAEFLQQGRG